jgi:hypothetical protein
VQGSAESEKAATCSNGYVAEENWFTLLGVFAELQNVIISFVTSVCLEHFGSQWMDFSLNLTFQGFLQICPENSGFIKI